jgi:hypothetical protein
MATSEAKQQEQLQKRKANLDKHLECMRLGLMSLQIKPTTQSGKTFCKGYIYAIMQTNENDIIYEMALLRGGNIFQEVKNMRESLNK